MGELLMARKSFSDLEEGELKALAKSFNGIWDSGLIQINAQG